MSCDLTCLSDDEADDLLHNVRDLIKAGIDDCLPSADIIGNVSLAISLAAAQEQKPLWLYEDDLPDGYPYDAMFEHSEVRNGVRMFPLYTAPQPAPGWNEEIEAAKKICDAEIEQTHNMSRMAAAEEIREQLEALHPSQSTSDAGGGVREAAKDVGTWLRGALDCKEWHWDADQREGAEDAYKALQTALSNPAAADSNASATATCNVGRWLSAALEDPNACEEFKRDIRAWMDAGNPNVQPADASVEARLRIIDECSDALGFKHEYLRTLLSKPQWPPPDPSASDCKRESAAQYRKAVNDTWRMNDKGEVPSDRSADVTVEDIAPIICEALFGIYIATETAVSSISGQSRIAARVLLDAFTVGRR